MDKREQLIEYITQDIVSYIVEDESKEYDEAMRMFYASATYMKLTDKDTGLYYESSAYVYDMFKQEQADLDKMLKNNGNISE